MVSVGGGPGTDVAGLLWLNREFLGHGTGLIHCHLLDLERSWAKNLPILRELYGPDMTLSYERCDVTQPLAAAPNRYVPAPVWDEADLYIFSYVCNETSALARAGGWEFYAALARSAKPGALFMFADVAGHSRRTLDAIHDVMAGAAGGRLRRLDMAPDDEVKAEVMVLALAQGAA